jgi:hypothetical protein
MTIALLKKNSEFNSKHYASALEFYNAIDLLCSDPDMIDVEIAASSSVYITVYSDESQDEEKIYRFADHANCRRYTNEKNVAPGEDALLDAIRSATNFLI